MERPNETIEPKRLVSERLEGLPQYKAGVSPRLLKALATGAPVARMASNENLFGPSPHVYEAIRETSDVHLYPDGEVRRLREAIAEAVSVSHDRIQVSTGSEKLLSTIFQYAVQPGDRVVLLSPTFMLAEILAGANGTELDRIPYGDALEFSADALSEVLARGDAKLVYLSNPNNPTGNAFTLAELESLLAPLSPTTLLVIDEAYHEYAAPQGIESSLPLLERLGRPYVLLRTFSKAYGLAGTRVGFGIFYDAELGSLLRRGGTIFDVGSISQRAALAALEDRAHMEKTVQSTLQQKETLERELAERGLRAFPSYGNFVSLWFDKWEEAIGLENALAEKAVFVKALPGRAGTSEGLVRVTVGRPEDNEMFLEALDQVRG